MRISDWEFQTCALPISFPEEQIAALIPLMHGIVRRHRITRGNIVAHSDIAPARKQDPGELFPWNTLARFRPALPRPTKNLMDPHWSDGGFLLALDRFGYDIRSESRRVGKEVVSKCRSGWSPVHLNKKKKP